ncbi:ATP-binding protein [Acinetobacter haemolyticus]|uniref:ATP-binding protein n=1 Tax=Acinetobacter haemolyticus TaxID=29430 RepID=UPI002DB90780|nr:ATP-binding protein [Acinetobacter haemolyticus]MEB6675573.1 ATP-binding protein [Acinetobacter haemolyticus]
MIIGLFGLSGSGKTFIRKKFQETHKDFQCYSASELLKEVNRPIERSSLNKMTLDENQCTLIKALKEKSKNSNIFIELHSIIEQSDSSSYFVKKEVLLSFNLDYIFLLDISPKDLMLQRQYDGSKERPTLTMQQLEKLSTEQKKYLKKIFNNKLLIIKNYNELVSKLNFNS